MRRATIVCRLCGVHAKRDGAAQALYCLPCAAKPKPRIASPGRQRAGSYKPLRLASGSWGCVDCLTPLEVRTDKRPRLRCGACISFRYAAQVAAKGLAHGIVARAVAKGLLPAASSHYCVDCGKPALHYDHRDYSRPLDVEPVCRSCNVMRGPAVIGAEPAQAGA